MQRRIIYFMTASVQKKGNYYHIYLRYKDTTGKWKSTSISTGLTVSGNNKRKAEQKRLEILHEWENKKSIGSNMLVSDFFKQWLDEIKTTVQPNTYRGYKGNMINHIIPYFSEKRITLRNLKVKHLEEYYRKMIESGLSAQTVKHHHQNISNALKSALRKELISSNPAQIAKTPKAEKFKGDFLNAEQVAELMQRLDKSPIRIPALLGAYYGLRRSEIIGLSWKFVDFENKRITIAQTVLQNTGGDYVRSGTKNDSSYRTLPMSDYIYNTLLQHKAWQEERKRTLKSKYIDSDFVCTFDNGKLISPNYLTKKFKAIIKESNLPQVRFHDLRHSVASNLLINGFSIVEVQEWLGHSSASTTLNFYSHIDSSKSKTAISKSLDNMIFTE